MHSQTAKKRYIPQCQLDIMGGTIKAMMKLFIQFEEAPMEVPLARMESGKISGQLC